jgi:hypothetical protein
MRAVLEPAASGGEPRPAVQARVVERRDPPSAVRDDRTDWSPIAYST